MPAEVLGPAHLGDLDTQNMVELTMQTRSPESLNTNGLSCQRP